MMISRQVTDHQGNMCVEFDNTGTGGTAKVRQENSYYPTGLIMANSPVATPTNDNKKLYNGARNGRRIMATCPIITKLFTEITMPL